MTTAFLEVRTQHSRGSGANRFGGPDTYVAVQIVPDGVERLKALDKRVADKRGIEIVHCGEGYYRRQATERSMLGKALADARKLVAEINV